MEPLGRLLQLATVYMGACLSGVIVAATGHLESDVSVWWAIIPTIVSGAVYPKVWYTDE